VFAGLSNLEWTRPVGLVALVLPLLLLFLSRRRERPEPMPVGTFELWRELGGTATGELRRRRVPLARLFLIAALTSGAVALGGPRRIRVDPPRIWRVVLDESPSMGLAHTDVSSAPTGVGTRYDSALALLDAFLAERGASRSDVQWVRPGVDGVSPVWERHDLIGTLWLTDRVPDVTPGRAGVIACGGGRVPGPVATTSTGILTWDGERLVEEPGAAPRHVLLQGELAEPVASLARLWAAQRGLAVSVGSADGEARDVALRIMGVEAGTGRDAGASVDAGASIEAGVDAEAIVTRDGWSGAAQVRRVPDTWNGTDLETWLQATVSGDLQPADPRSGAPWPVVRWRRGAVLVGLTELDGPQGDPAAFVVSWSELFDRAVQPAPGVVAVGERAEAGPSLVRPPAAGPRPAVGAVHPWPLVSVLAALAAALAALALLLGGGRP